MDFGKSEVVFENILGSSWVVDFKEKFSIVHC